MEIREREKFMVCLHVFPAVYSWKSDSLPAWYSFVPATPLYLNYQNIPQRPTWIDDPKQYLNDVQLATKLHYIAPLIRISKLSGNVDYHRYEAQRSLLVWCCPQYISQPAEGSLIYRVQPEHLMSSRAPRGPGGGSAQGGGQQPGAGPAGRAGQLPGCKRQEPGKHALSLAGGQRREGGGCSPQRGHRMRNLNEILTLSLSQLDYPVPLSADCLLLFLTLKATVTSIFPLFTFAF